MIYSHTQYGRWHYIFFAIAAAIGSGAWLARSNAIIFPMILAIAAVFAITGLLLGSLTVSDEGECLALRYGPLPLLRKTIRYADITGVEIGRSMILDGWGIHYMPGRGWTYNIWGFACVKITLGRKVIRVGTDDAEELAKHIGKKIGGKNGVS